MVGQSQVHILLGRVQQIMGGASDRDTKLQQICELLHREVEYYDWVGFYLTDHKTRELVLGPFVGEPTEHVRIPFGRGICGQAAERQETFTVQDVSREDNYLSCSPNVLSEIVVPILNEGRVLGELDIDSHSLSPFGSADLELLEGICDQVAGLF